MPFKIRQNQVRQAFEPDTYRGFVGPKHSLILCQHVRLESLTYKN